MKRNFLLMLLLTLLPMAIWAAEPLTSAKMSVRNVPYGTEELNATVQTNAVNGDFRSSWDRDLVLGTDFTWDQKYYSNQACTTEVTSLKTAPVGYYYVKFVGKGFFEGEVVCSFQILKRKLFVSVLTDESADDFLYTTYGVPVDVTEVEDPEPVAWLSTEPSGLVNEEQFEDVVSGEVTAVITTKGESDANADDEGKPFTIIIPADPEDPEAEDSEVDVQPYAVTLVGLTSDNYEIVCVDGLYIKQKNISDGEGLTFSLPVNSATYNGQVQEPEYKITYGNAVLVQGEDFTVSYPDFEELLGFEGPKEVQMNNNEVVAYKTLITGQGNYTGTYPGVEGYGEDPFLWTIEPVGLTIITLDQTKMYNGTDALPSTERGEAYEVLLPYGVVIEDAEIEDAIGNISISVENSSPDVKWDGNNVVGRTIKATVTANPNKNYDYNIQNAGKFTITPRGLTITASDATKKVTVENDPTFSVANPDGYEFEITEKEEEKGETFVNNLKNTLRQDITDGRYTFIKGTYNNNDKPYAGANLNVTRQNASTDKGVGEYQTLKVNYTNQGKIKNYTVTTVNGTFTITGGKIYITALAQSKNYGDDDPDWTAVMGTNYRLDVENQPNLTNKVTVDGIVLTRVEGETPGTYTISASGAVLPAGYDKIVYANGPFTINPRPITITLANQTMKDGDKVSTLDQNAYTLEGTLAPGDEASDLFKLELVPYEIADENAQNALVKFTSWSAEIPGTQGEWQYGHGVVEVKDYDEFLEATLVHVKRNIADGATTGAQAQAFEDKDFYIGLQATYNDDGEVVDVPVGARQELLYPLTSDEAKSGIFVQLTGKNVVEEKTYYTFTSWSAAQDGDQWGLGTVQLLNYDNGTAKLVVTANEAPEGASPQAQADAAAFIDRTFFVENVDPEQEDLPVDRLQFLSQNTGIYIAIGQTVRPKLVEESGVYVEGTGKKTAVALRPEDGNLATYSPGIYVNILDAEKWANYDVTNGGDIEYVYGEDEAEVTVPAATLYVITKDALVLDRDDADLAAKIEAADGENKFIAFKGITLKAGRWNTLVLPFDTSVEELSDEFGYSVVDMLDETNTNANTITISLAFGDIPANTPFLIQPKEDVVLSDGFFFFDTPVVYSENPVAEDGANHKLVGTYTGVSIEANSADKYVYQPSAKEFRHPGANGANLKPLMAYLQDETGAATRIFIQEPDGENTVTAIGEIAAEVENEAQATDGWYSVSGMKLNAAPTQKGIFIKDGKKFLIAK